MQTLSDQIISFAKSQHQYLPSSFFVNQVSVDSRAVKRDDLFVALPGAQVDGHQYLQAAFENGARLALIRQDHAGSIPEGMAVIRVEDTLITMQKLAQERVLATNGKVIALTGSVGKTTTKDFIGALASFKWKTFVTAGNQNSQVGLSQTILNSLKGDEEVLVIEMGMTNSGDITKLLEIAPPDVSLVVQVALVHAQFFENGLQDIARAKAEIFSHPKTTAGLINLDTNCVDILFNSNSIPKKGYSSKNNPKAFLTLEIGENELIFQEDGKSIKAPKPSFPVRHVYDNLLAAVAAVRSIQMPWSDILQALKSVKLPERRLEIVRRGSVDIINDSYNAAEPSMKSALDCLSSFSQRRRVAILGQMRELGKFSKECHENVAKHALGRADLLLCLGEECAPMVEVWKNAKRPVQWVLTFDELSEVISKTIVKDDVLLLKGSRSNGLWRVLDVLQEKK